MSMAQAAIGSGALLGGQVVDQYGVSSALWLGGSQLRSGYRPSLQPCELTLTAINRSLATPTRGLSEPVARGAPAVVDLVDQRFSEECLRHEGSGTRPPRV